MYEIYDSPFYRNNDDIKIIKKAMQRITDLMIAETKRLQLNQFILTADEMGIVSFEELFKIVADPQTEDLEFRRKRLILRNSMMPPYTYFYLLDSLDSILGQGKYECEVDSDKFHLYRNLCARCKRAKRNFKFC